MEEFLQYLRHWKDSTENRPGNFTKNARAKMFNIIIHSADWAEGVIICKFFNLVTIAIERPISYQSGNTKGRKDRKKAWEQVIDAKLPSQNKIYL